MENESKQGEMLAEQLAMGALMSEISSFLSSKHTLGEMLQMDIEVSEAITTAETERYNCYRQSCLNELAERNKTPGLNGALSAAVERGFIIGYWFALQRSRIDN